MHDYLIHILREDGERYDVETRALNVRQAEKAAKATLPMGHTYLTIFVRRMDRQAA